MQKPRAIVGRASDTSALPAERNNSEKQPRLDARTRRSRVDGPLTELLIRARGDIVRSRLGSALKFAWVADGRIDAYPRLAPTREWDVAAGHAIVTAAGGAVTDSRGEPLEFGQIPTGFAIPEFIAWGDPGFAEAGGFVGNEARSSRLGPPGRW